jgi:hypothetical protein
MDQKYLVDSQIDEGLGIAKALLAGGVDLIAAFWAYSEELARWTLHLVANASDEKAWVDIFRRLRDAMPEDEDAWVSRLDVTVIREKEPLAQLALDIRKKHPGPKATRSRRKSLADYSVDEVYVYPPIEAAAPPSVKVTGVKKVVHGTTTAEVPELVGYVKGFVGGAEFNTNFADLIKTKFGSTEQFATAYPRVILEEAERT